MADYDVIVIGAGLGGLTSGAISAARGRKVLVLEQSDLVGGCCSTFEKEGYHFDIGASIVEVVGSLEKAFDLLGTSMEKELNLSPCDPIYDYILKDGTRFQFPISSEGTAEVIKKVAPEDAAAWPAFASYMKEFLELATDSVLGSPMVTMRDFAGLFLKYPALLKYRELFTSSYEDVIKKWFKTSAMQQTAAYQSFYLGLPPELCGGVYAMLGYTEHEGSYYPQGGMIEIPLAYKRCGEKYGMEVRTGQRVDRVIVRNRTAEGVILSDGTAITAPVVISNINAMTLYLKLIGEENLPWLARVGIKSYEPSMSVPMIFLGVDYEPELHAHHALISRPLEDMDDYWWNIYKKNKLPDDMFSLICWPTESDPSLAPKGHHVVNLIMTPGPYRLEGTTWDREKEAYIEKSIDFVTRHAMPGLKDHVKVVEMCTPVDYERRLLNPEGAIYGLQQETTASMVFRPSAKSKSIKGLYLSGASTHPGGGVPSVVSSGIIAADLVQEYE
ncbi:MAG TPA: NAD(P)/FAD-dependent oxidoreductase [Candidatus Anoxymicrobiaceae bacterium]